MLERVIIDYAPLIIVMGSVIAIVFMSMLYSILKMIFAPARAPEAKRAKRKGGQPPDPDPRQLDEALQRAAVLDQRLRNLEDILAEKKPD